MTLWRDKGCSYLPDVSLQLQDTERKLQHRCIQTAWGLKLEWNMETNSSIYTKYIRLIVLHV